MFREPKNNFLVVGDVHGSFAQMDKAIRHAKELELDTIFQVGDFGIWHNDKPFLNQQQALLEQWGIELYFIDGNHEDFTRLYDKKILDDGTRYVRDNITYIPRGYRWDWHGLSFLGLGGAASIDRKHRIEGRSWWPEEFLTEEDILTAQAGGPVDIMLTHDSPAGAPNSVTDDFRGQKEALEYFGAEMLATCTWHREQLKRVTDITTPRILIHGHYHMSMYGTYVHGDENHTVGDVRGLHQGFAPVENFTMVFDFDEIKGRISTLDTIKK